MASIQSNKGKAGKKTYYVVICHRGGHKWVKAGTLRDAKILKREIESLENSKQMEKLGLTGQHISTLIRLRMIASSVYFFGPGLGLGKRRTLFDRHSGQVLSVTLLGSYVPVYSCPQCRHLNLVSLGTIRLLPPRYFRHFSFCPWLLPRTALSWYIQSPPS